MSRVGRIKTLATPPAPRSIVRAARARARPMDANPVGKDTARVGTRTLDITRGIRPVTMSSERPAIVSSWRMASSTRASSPPRML
jgi:hypothetical protein